MKNRVTILISIIVVFFLMMPSSFAGDTESPVVDSTKAQTESEAAQAADSGASVVVAYYFHGTRRCVTCKKLEAYSKEAIEAGFAEQLESGAIQWKPVNVDEEGNEHFTKDYQLYTKSVILSEMRGDKEVKWKNLDKIWTLVRGDKEAYLKYIQDEVTAFMGEG